MIRLQRSFAAAMPDLAVPHRAAPCPDPRIIARSDDLARELGIDPSWLDTPEGLALLTGRIGADGAPCSTAGEDAAGGAAADGIPRSVPVSSRATPVDGTPGTPSGAPRLSGEPFTVAQVYAGHQFGQPNPQLGDGRALLLGDLVDAHGNRRDLHLKGIGPTPLARGGDGWAPLGPMLRELLIGEAMHALGIPTTRGLAVVETGRPVLRRGPVPERGAILARVAASHLRVGSFQYAAWHLGPDAVRDLVEHAIDRHWPEAREEPVPALGLLRCVMRAQAHLVAQWMLTGFVHGVMNTDNMTISGETIDYGPCAFVDRFATDACFSSIDVQRRYAYGNQPGIALWNLSRLAEALLPVIDADADAAVSAATAVLEDFEGAYLRAWTDGMARKLGIALSEDADSLRRGDGADKHGTTGQGMDAGTNSDDASSAATTRRAAVRALGEDCLRMLQRHRVDLTLFFRALTDAELAAASTGTGTGTGTEAGTNTDTNTNTTMSGSVPALAGLFPDSQARAELDAWLARRRHLIDTSANGIASGIGGPRDEGDTRSAEDEGHARSADDEGRARATDDEGRARATGDEGGTRSADGSPASACRRSAELMASANPVVIPRNRHVDAALRAAELGDMAPFERLLAAVRDPFVHHPGLEDLEGPGEDDGTAFITYCGT